jgi:hypothetical protein
MAEHTPSSFFDLMNNPIKRTMFLLLRLPSAWFSGVRIVEFSAQQAVVSVPYKWFSKNPFGSTYFACLSMAAEMSTGILAMSAVYQRNPPVSMLVTAMQAKFQKKAKDITTFSCQQGMEIKLAIEQCINTNAAVSIEAYAIGRNKAGELVAEFSFTWSFKPKSAAAG